MITVHKLDDEATSEGTTDARKYLQPYRVEIDEDTTADNPLTARTAPTVPEIGDKLTPTGGVIDAQMVCLRTACGPRQRVKRADKEVSIYRVVAEYSTVSVEGPAGFPQRGDGGADPLTEPPEITYGFELRQESVFQAFKPPTSSTLEPLVNTARQPFDPPIVEDRVDEWIRITRHEAILDLATVSALQGSVNGPLSSGFNTSYGVDPYQAKLEITARRVYETGVPLWIVSYLIKFRFTPSGWNRELVQLGTMELKPGFNDASVITDDRGHPIDQPVYLDALGAPDTTPYSEEWRTLKVANFDSISPPLPVV